MNNRKFNLTVGILLVNMCFAIAHLITSEQWMTLCMGVLAMYIVGNVTQKFRGDA